MKAQFHLHGMHCDTCAGKIQQALEALHGVRRADVSFHGKTATVDYDENEVQEQTLLKRVQEIGYAATVGHVAAKHT